VPTTDICDNICHLTVRVTERELGTCAGCGHIRLHPAVSSGVPRNFFRGGWGGQQIQLRTEDGEDGDLGAVAH